MIKKVTLFAAAGLMSAGTAAAANLELANTPLFLSANVAPNVMFILDDSGSMQFEAMPDDIASLPYAFLPKVTDRQSYLTGWSMNGFPRGDEELYGAGDYQYSLPPLFKKTSIYNAIYRSSALNKLYYDPTRTYEPWTDSFGNSQIDSQPVCAPHQPGLDEVDRDCSSLDVPREARNLTTEQSQEDSTWWDVSTISCSNARNGFRSYYQDGSPYIFDTVIGCEAGAKTGHRFQGISDSDGDQKFYPATYASFNQNGGRGDFATPQLNPANYTLREIKSGGLRSYNLNGKEIALSSTFPHPGTRQDCQSTAFCTYQEEIQNFANWYTYYRSRISLARAGAGKAFSTVANNSRVGFTAINYTQTRSDPIKLKVLPYDSSGRASFYKNLYEHPIPTAGTPLRRALQSVGEYYSDGSSTGPWAEAGFANIRECRQSYSILTTDGYWNGSDPTFSGGGNIDNIAGQVITSPDADNKPYQYEPVPPYRDSDDKTLADVAMYYWKRDLLPKVANRVRPNDEDPAFWQHMGTYTVGLGVNGTLNFPGDLAEIINGNKSWPRVSANDQTTLDDLWHAAVNGRGSYFSAANATEFADSLSAALNQIQDKQGASGSIAANTGSVSDDSSIYRASFDSANWSGDLQSIPIRDDSRCNNGFADTLCEDKSWSASEQISKQNFDTGREIITTNALSGAGVPFRKGLNVTGALDTGQVNYLRGDTSNEGLTLQKYRRRDGVLGDIVNSSPVFEGIPSRVRYPVSWTDRMNSSAVMPETNYGSFRAAKSGRDPMVIVGSNGGMVHVINADTGREMLGFVPQKIVPKLLKTSLIGSLTQQNYTHRFLVDATPATTDAFYAGAWHTNAVGGLGGGGQAVYALDITGGTGFFDESNAKNIALWEFDDTDDADLGYTYGQPSIVRLHNGRWAAVFGNGYNNTAVDGPVSLTGQAAVYVVDLETGKLLKKFATGAGRSKDPTGGNRANGIANVAPVDVDGDFITDYFYAGDLFGNVWKFDVTAASEANWNTAFGGKPFFTAADAEGDAQAITAAPTVRQHPYGVDYGIVVYFGTGKYIEEDDADPNTDVTNSMYGIWDTDIAGVDTSLFTPPTPGSELTRASKLQQQSILSEQTENGRTVRIISDNPSDRRHLRWLEDGVRGFYLDLKFQTDTGEMVVATPALRGEILVFTTLIPGVGDCNAEPDSFVMALDASTGGRIAFSPFDLNNDKQFTDEDAVSFNNEEVFVGGFQADQGALGTPTFMAGGETILGMIGVEEQFFLTNPGTPPQGRRAWRELRRQ